MRSLKNILREKNNNRTNLFIDNNTLINTISLENNININSAFMLLNIPNTPIGLSQGSVWRDGDGFLRIV